MIDASGTVLPAEALHPLSPCAGCRRVMVTTAYAKARPEDTVVFSAKGKCRTCAKGLDRTIGHDVARALASAHRGAPMAVEQTRSGLQNFLRARQHRIQRSRRRALASALATGWEAAR